MKTALRFFCMLFFTLVSMHLRAADLSPKATVSLLIASPDTRQLVTCYGHTLLRINDPESGIDYVFNYGTFDQSLSGFQTMWGILRARLQYEIWVMPFSEYYQTTLAENRKLTEYSFNFSYEEKQRVWQRLLEIVKDKDRKFTFDFFSQNCTTFVRDFITQNTGSQIKLPVDIAENTFREINIRHIQQNSWYVLMYDLLAGINLDKKTGSYKSLYIPDQLQNVWSKSVLINNNGSAKPVFEDTVVLISGEDLTATKTRFLLSPLFMSLLAVVFVLFSMFGFKNVRYCKSVDYVLFGSVGLIGIFFFIFKFLCGEWYVLPDLKMLWIHPVHIIVPFLMYMSNMRLLKIYHFANMIISVGLLAIVPFFPQVYNPVFIIILILLLSRSALFVFTKETQQ